ncbi:MAG: alpha-mannosidase, partial [Anaerolineae bacterium]|nr:alpha-mannosidase [Anaerolineae bacterium]
MPLIPFRYQALASPLVDPPVGLEVDDCDWLEIQPDSYWSQWRTNFVLRTRFQVPPEWPDDSPAALFLPLGVLGTFSHPEALAYVDGEAYAACDRHHQEIVLSPRWRDGSEHVLALHGWTGGGVKDAASPYMKACAVA